MDRKGIRQGNNAGLVAATAGPDLLHTLSAGKSAFIRKIMISNFSGGNLQIQLGTLTGAGAFVALMPTILAVNGIDTEITEENVPNVEFITDSTAGAAGRTGNIYLQSSAVAALCLTRIEVEEIG
jgi:hypothetical protein